MQIKHLKLITQVVSLVFVAVFSILFLAPWVTNSSYIDKTIESLDESREVVLALSASATVVSVAVTVLPDDTATPVAEKITDIAALLLIVLSTIYLEKFMVSLSAAAVFKLLVPIICILLVIMLFVKREKSDVREKYLSGAIRLGILAVALLIVIPVSMKVSMAVQSRYENAIQATIDAATQSAEKIQEGASDLDNEEETTTSIFGQILSNLKEAGDTIAAGVSNMTEYLKTLLTKFLDAVALLLVTSCLIPLLTALFFIWLLKILFGINILTGMNRLERRIISKLKRNKTELIKEGDMDE